MQRVSVVGASGAGKTTFTHRLAAVLDAPLLELDAEHHGPDWTPRPAAEMQEVAARFCEADRWVVDGNYSAIGVRAIVWAQADTVVWLDHSRLRQTVRVAVRSARRVIRGEELWNGNRETLRVFWLPDQAESVIRDTWARIPHARRRYLEAMVDPAHEGPRFVRLRGFAETDTFLDLLGRSGVPPAPRAPP